MKRFIDALPHDAGARRNRAERVFAPDGKAVVPAMIAIPDLSRDALGMAAVRATGKSVAVWRS